MPRVNPDNLRWARETASLSVDEAARRLGIAATKSATSVQRLQQFEAGEATPPRGLLSTMSGVYRRPLLALYAANPPRAADRLEDFRALPDRRPEAEPLVQALARDVRARQGLVRAVLDEDEAEALGFVASIRLADGIEAAAEAVRRHLRFDLARFRASGTADAAFAYLRERVESLGVFVLLIGDLGSHHTEIHTEAFRGFALADPIAPFIVINDRDAHTAWAFTLLHELVHVFLGVSGVSGAHPTTGVERFCNEVASLVLLPQGEERQIEVSPDDSLEDIARAIASAANPRRLSRTLIAFRLYRSGTLTENQWEELRGVFAQEWRHARARRRDERRQAAGEERGGGPDYYVVRRQRLGKALIALVGRAVSEGALTPTKAGKVLGVSPRSVDTLVSQMAATLMAIFS